jgi:hypothetical protein
MRKVVWVFVVAFALFAAQESLGQEPMRIQFAKGKNSSIVRGNTGAYGKTFVVTARGGQKIVLVLTPRTGVGIRVETNGSFGEQVLLREERGGTYEVGLEENGDYTILIGSTNGKSAAFALTVKIIKMTDI